MKKVAIITGFDCNNNCVFCYNKEKRQTEQYLSTEDIKKNLTRAKKEGTQYIDLVGGEVTIRKDALTLIRFAAHLGYKIISLTTNGRAFAYKPLLEKFKDAGLNSLIFSVHGHTPELHDKQTRVAGSFKQLLRAIENAKSLGFKISTNTTINNYNYKSLPEIARFLYDLGSRNGEFPFFDPKGKNQDDIRRLMPKVADASPYVRKCLDIGIEKNIKHWHVRYFPLCYLNGYENQLSEGNSPFSKEMHFGPGFTNMDVDTSRQKIGRKRIEECEECSKKDKCEGFSTEYLQVFFPSLLD